MKLLHYITAYDVQGC